LNQTQLERAFISVASMVGALWRSIIGLCFVCLLALGLWGPAFAASCDSNPMAAQPTLTSRNRSARMVRIVICNATEDAFALVSSEMDHGTLTSSPPEIISSHSYGEFEAVSNGLFTGTEGNVWYAGVGGHVLTFRWGNPFLGRNSYAVTAAGSYSITAVGNEGNRTVLGFFVRSASNIGTDPCIRHWVVNQLSIAPQSRLTALDESSAFVTTPLFKKNGISGWTSTGCEATAEGVAVYPIAHSNDRFYTLDLSLRRLTIDGESTTPHGRYMRVEIEPDNVAHSAADRLASAIRAGTAVRVTGIVKIDTDGPFLEIHPLDPDGSLSLVK
jgi:hypothetical protein